MKKTYTLFSLILILISSDLYAAEPDSVIFTNDNYIVGEVKGMPNIDVTVIGGRGE